MPHHLPYPILLCDTEHGTECQYGTECGTEEWSRLSLILTKLTFRWILLVCTTGRLYVLAGAVDIAAATQPQPQPMVGTVRSAVMVEQPGGVLQPLFSNKGEPCQKLMGFVLLGITLVQYILEHPPFPSLNAEKHDLLSGLAVYPIISSEPPKYYCVLSSEALRTGSIDVSKAGRGTEMLVEEAPRK